MSTSIATKSDAEQALAGLNDIMDRLIATIEEETARARAGRVAGVAELSATKVELARLYSVESERVKSALARILPDAIESLRKRHAAFRSLLQTNMTVLATAHAVSEGIIRGVSGQLARKRAPSTYGASGKANTLSPKASQPLALSRTL